MDFGNAWDFTKRTLPHRTLSRPSIFSVLKTVGLELDNDLTPASYSAALPTCVSLYGRAGDVLLDNLTFLIFSQRCFA